MPFSSIETRCQNLSNLLHSNNSNHRRSSNLAMKKKSSSSRPLIHLKEKVGLRVGPMVTPQHLLKPLLITLNNLTIQIIQRHQPVEGAAMNMAEHNSTRVNMLEDPQ